MPSYRRVGARRYTAAQKAAYYARVAKGRGAYSLARRPVSRAVARPKSSSSSRSIGYGGKMIRAAGALAGGYLTGSLPGAYLGAKAGAAFSKVLGFGAYKLKKNSLMSNGVTPGQVPFMHSARDGVRVRHREFIQDISSSITFSNNTFNINPGLSDTFPWLSALAQNFEQYRFEGLIFEFKSTSADALNSTNTALGTIIGSAEYNAAQPAYINKQQMENSMWAQSGKPSCDLIVPIECDPSQNAMMNQYVRVGAVPSGQDIRMYDIGNVQFATVGSQAAAVIGELWVSYDIVLLKPQMSNGLNLAGQCAHYQLTSPAITTAYFGSSRTASIDTIGLSLSGTVITFPIGCQGYYFLSYSVTGTSASVSTPSIAWSNVTAVSTFANNASVYVANSGASTVYIFNLTFKITDPTVAGTITFSSGTLPTSATSGDLVVTQLNGNYA